MAINVRYGDTGDLGSLAVQAGKGQDFWRRFQAEQQLVQQARQAQMQREAQRLEAMRLNAAQNVQRQIIRGSGTPAGRAYQVQTPVAQSISKQLPRQPQGEGTGMVRGREPGGAATVFATQPGQEIRGQRTYTDATGRQVTEAIPADEARQRGGFAAYTPPATADPTAQAKAQFVEALNLPDEARRALAPLVMDPNIDLNQMAIRAQAFREQADASAARKGQQFDAARYQLQAERAVTEDAIKSLERALRDEFNIDPATTRPADLLTTQGGGYFGGPESSVPKDPQAFQAYQQYLTLKQKQQQLLQQEKQLVQEVRGASGGGAASDPAKMSNEELLKALQQ